MPPNGLRSKKGNLKAKTGKSGTQRAQKQKREFKKPKREKVPKENLKSQNGNLCQKGI